MTMRVLTIAALVASGLICIAPSADAQSRNRADSVPVNFPPASFQGKQFVDNNGCVFVRAGFDGAVTWVPRVARNRAQICGQQPTFVGVSAPAPAAKPAVAPVQITLDAPAPAPAAKRMAVAPTPARQPQATRVVVKAPPSKPANAQPPRLVRRAPQKAAPAAVVAAPAATPAPRKVNVVRREAAPAVGKTVLVMRANDGAALAPGTRIVPRHVYEQRDTQVPVIPKTYRPAWTDDRLNPYRAYQTVDGYRKTQRVWTNTVPRESVATDKRHKRKEPVIAYRVRGKLPAEAVKRPGRTPVLSTKSRAASGARYVEIGLFSTHAKAQSAIARLQNAGLPVSYADTTRNGKSLRRVMVGPYASASSAKEGLRATHRTGYTQAFLR